MPHPLIRLLRKFAGASPENLCVGGYAGCGNLGDDAVLQGFLHTLPHNGSVGRITVLTGSPRRDSRRFSVRCVQRKALFPVLAAFLRSGRFLCGGGSLLQNGTGDLSLFYYLFLLRAARFCGCETELLAAGIGPVRGKKNRARLCAELNRCRKVEVRDPDSLRWLICLGVRRELLTLVPDPAYFLPMPPPSRRPFLLSEAGIDPKTPYFCVVLRTVRKKHGKRKVAGWLPGDPFPIGGCAESGQILGGSSGSAGQILPRKVIAILRLISSRHGLLPVFFVTDRKNDRSVAIEICRAVGGKLIDLREASDALALLEGSRFLFSMRLHALIFADRLGVPSLALAVGDGDPKLPSFCRTAGIPLFSPLSAVPSIVSAADRAAKRIGISEHTANRPPQRPDVLPPRRIREREERFLTGSAEIHARLPENDIK